MEIALWLTQSCLLSVALFVLLGEELVLDHKGNVLLLKAVAGQKTRHYLNNSQCYVLQKSAKWQISFGVLAAAQTSFLLVVFGLRSHRKSPQPILPVLCVTSWLLAVFLLFAKIVIYLTPITAETVAKGDYISTVFTLAWDAMRAVFAACFHKIFHAAVHSISSNYMRDELQSESYFCLPEGRALEDVNANIPRATIVLVIAYFISTGYTLSLVLTHDEESQRTDPNQYNSARLRRSAKRRGHGCDSLDMGGEGEGQRRTKTEMYESRNCLHEKNKSSVAFLEESDDESFVFGWRL